jgi:hypothetical protein
MSANLVLLVYFSITARSRVNRFDENNNRIWVKKKKIEQQKEPLRSANCASLVMASASSNRTNLTAGFALHKLTAL